MKKNSEIQKKITRCAIYTRVSTDQQAGVEFNSCEAQDDRIRSFIASQDGFQVAKVYSDPGYSGANVDRPALRRLVNDVKAGLLDMIITYKIDRLTRSPKDFYQLIEVFEAYGTSYISVTERFDTSTPAGRLLRNIMLTFAQFERELASERIRDKFAQRAQRGLYNGGLPPVGYRKEKGRLIIDNKRAPVVRFIFEKFAETQCAHKVTLALRERWHDWKLGDWFVRSVLKSPAAAGKITYKGKIMPGVHKPIISEELYDYVQDILKNKPLKPKGDIHLYHHLPFAGIVECMECRTIMSPTYTDRPKPDGQRRYFYYRCTSTRHRGWGACTTRQIGAERLEDTIHQNLLRLSRDPVYLKQMLFSLKNSQPQPGLNGVEPDCSLEPLTPEILQEALQGHILNCARKTGIEKALAVRRGIERVYYSKETITVRFVWSRPPDGISAQNSRNPATQPQPEPANTNSSRKDERPASKTEPGPAFDFDGKKNVELILRPPTVCLPTPNIAHDYWTHYRLTGEYHLRPTL